MATQEDDELEALFDSIASEHQQVGAVSSVQTVAPVVDDESDEALEALFDNIVAGNKQKSAPHVAEPVVTNSVSYDVDDESEDALEALFDNLVAQNKQSADPVMAPSSEAVVQIVIPDNVDESDEGLEALFDNIAAQKRSVQISAPVTATNREPEPVVNAPHESDAEHVFNKIGQLTRTLHNTLRELGLHEEIQKVAFSIPDTRGRLSYVAALTSQAAEKVLNATEAAQPVVEKIELDARQLSQKWDMLFDRQLSVTEFRDLVGQTQSFLKDVPDRARLTNSYLMDIMMAQDFQDLTGQVIKKITDLTNDMERQLLALLVENAPAKIKQEVESGLLNGPVIDPTGRTDIVTSQDDVDDLLESLGF